MLHWKSTHKHSFVQVEYKQIYATAHFGVYPPPCSCEQHFVVDVNLGVLWFMHFVSSFLHWNSTHFFTFGKVLAQIWEEEKVRILTHQNMCFPQSNNVVKWKQLWCPVPLKDFVWHFTAWSDSHTGQVKFYGLLTFPCLKRAAQHICKSH